VRTRYIDDCLVDALRHGAKQVVILGAGFDRRAYRIREIAQSRVFEADHPATQVTKEHRLGSLPSQCDVRPDRLHLRHARRGHAGRGLVFTYVHRGMLDGSAQFAGADNTLATVRRAGEPYTFGFEPADLPRYLAARNLALVEDVGADTYRERYLTPRGRGAEPLSEYQRAALAKVGASS
jgi:O-methyltransferase involved in polyketide biosynthesis